jgi:hypothetical protein
MRIFFVFLLLTITRVAFGQDNYKKGYIVGNNGDTTRGYIKEETEEELSNAIEFRNQEGFTRTLSAVDIKGFGFDVKNPFRVVNYSDLLDDSKRKTHFAKLLLEGTYQVFSFRRKDDLYFIVSNKDTSYFLYDDLITNMGQLIENGNYLNQLFFIAHECPGVQRTAYGTRFTEEGFISFFKSFEKCRSNLAHTNIYYSRPKSQMHILLSAGAMSMDKKKQVTAQALVQFVIPAISKKTSLNTGFAYLSESSGTSEPYSFGEVRNKYITEIFEIPFLIRYDIAKKMIQPYMFGGPGVLLKREKRTTTQTSLSTETTVTSQKSSFLPTFIAAVGIDIRITKNLFVDLNWRCDLTVRLPSAGLTIKIK